MKLGRPVLWVGFRPIVTLFSLTDRHRADGGQQPSDFWKGREFIPHTSRYVFSLNVATFPETFLSSRSGIWGTEKRKEMSLRYEGQAWPGRLFRSFSWHDFIIVSCFFKAKILQCCTTNVVNSLLEQYEGLVMQPFLIHFLHRMAVRTHSSILSLCLTLHLIGLCSTVC